LSRFYRIQVIAAMSEPHFEAQTMIVVLMHLVANCSSSNERLSNELGIVLV
jgi:hypothetical protein